MRALATNRCNSEIVPIDSNGATLYYMRSNLNQYFCSAKNSLTAKNLNNNNIYLFIYF